MKTAVVVLDMPNDFVDGTFANAPAKAVIDPAQVEATSFLL